MLERGDVEEEAQGALCGHPNIFSAREGKPGGQGPQRKHLLELPHTVKKMDLLSMVAGFVPKDSRGLDRKEEKEHLTCSFGLKNGKK